MTTLPTSLIQIHVQICLEAMEKLRSNKIKLWEYSNKATGNRAITAIIGVEQNNNDTTHPIAVGRDGDRVITLQ